MQSTGMGWMRFEASKKPVEDAAYAFCIDSRIVFFGGLKQKNSKVYKKL
jgi:hypothetical protein